MNEDKFWEIIEQCKKDEKLNVDRLVHNLSMHTEEEIYKFEELLTDALYQLDGLDYAKAVGYEDKKYFSVDSFLYSRAFVVEQGKEFYKSVIKNPSLMPNETSETLLYIASKAFQKKTGKEDWNYIPKKLYETYFNRKGWNLGEELSIEEFIEGK